MKFKEATKERSLGDEIVWEDKGLKAFIIRRRRPSSILLSGYVIAEFAGEAVPFTDYLTYNDGSIVGIDDGGRNDLPSMIKRTKKLARYFSE